MKVAILQGIVPHYREDFFQGLSEKIENLDIFIYEDNNLLHKKRMKEGSVSTKKIFNFKIFGIIIYNISPLLKYDVIVIPGEIRSLSAWLLLLLSKFTNKKIILWGHGISIKNYLNEQNNLSKSRILFHKLCSHIWLYTFKEYQIYKKYFNNEKLTYLNNTIDTSEILKIDIKNKVEIKNKYHISTPINLIYCARFTQNRRVDLMVQVMKKLDPNKFGLIIIGDGEYKPDFSKFENVYDFGSIYDRDLKNELFAVADLYFQPGWTGLSIVEAMAYGKPILTFERSESVYQSVEYAYIINEINGYIAKDMESMIMFLNGLTIEKIKILQENSRKYVQKNLLIENMVTRATNSIKRLNYEN